MPCTQAGSAALPSQTHCLPKHHQVQKQKQPWPLADIISGPDFFEEDLQVLKRVLFSSSPIYGSLHTHHQFKAQLTQRPEEISIRLHIPQSNITNVYSISRTNRIKCWKMKAINRNNFIYFNNSNIKTEIFRETSLDFFFVWIRNNHHCVSGAALQARKSLLLMKLKNKAVCMSAQQSKLLISRYDCTERERLYDNKRLWKLLHF